MTFSEDCLELFATNDLYQILNLDRNNAPIESKIKKAYYQQSILWHPDRFSSSQHGEAEKNLATRKFQIIGKAYFILSDKEKRKIYDQSGSLDDENVLDDGTKDWVATFRGMFKKVTKEDIEEFLRKFRGSEEEMQDIKAAYLKYKGNMNKIMETVIGAELPQEDRIREIIRYFIEKGEVEAFPKFANEPPSARIKRINKAKKEEKEAGKILKEMQKEVGTSADGQGDDDLTALILAKQKKRAEQQGDFLAQLEQKYGKGQGEPEKKKSRKK